MLIWSQRVDNGKHGLGYEHNDNANSAPRTVFVKGKEVVSQQSHVVERKPVKKPENSLVRGYLGQAQRYPFRRYLKGSNHRYT